MMPNMKITVRVCLLWFALWAGHSVQAEDGTVTGQEPEVPSLLHQIGMKLGRGIANFATGWAEIPKQIYVVGQNQGWMTGALRGSVDGLGMFVARTVAGAYEIVSFPVPIPPHYQPLLQPDFIWQPEAPLDRREAASPSQGSVADPEAKEPALP
jgi:putative exosortase-associated protein (TIGR04073 family)